MDQTPITLNAKASFQLTVSMFQKLGLRYVLFVDRGTLKGLLTKKDVWFVLNGMDEQDADTGGIGVGQGRGVVREQTEDDGSEERGLLATPTDEDDEGRRLR
jgi:chloride channel 3/4/5